MDKRARVVLVVAFLMAGLLMVSFVLASKGSAASQKALRECNDRIDNDRDGRIDLADAGCSSRKDNDESNCGDGVCEGGETTASCSQDCKPADSCSDSDGGNVISVFGTVSGYLGGSPYSNSDYCVDTSSVRENYCSGAYAQNSQQSCGTDSYGSDYCLNSSVYRDFNDYYCSGGACGYSVTPQFVINCNYGCSGGACNPAPADSCSDSDGGNVINVFGTVSGYLGGSPYSNSDYCVDTSSVRENYCSGAYAQNSQQSCGTDAYSPNYCSGSLVYRNFTDYYCGSGACSSSVTPQLVSNCDYGCSGGVCNPVPDSCSDTDGGNIIGIFGTVTGYLAGLSYRNADFCADQDSIEEFYCEAAYAQTAQQSCGTDSYGSDYCLNSSVYRDFTNRYCSSGACSSSTTPQLVKVCDYGCSGGVCSPAPDSCSDSDGGFVNSVQGTVSGYLNQQPYSYTDFCTGNSTLTEHYCSANHAYNTLYDCGTNSSVSCVNGACV